MDTWSCKSRNQTGLQITYRGSLAYRLYSRFLLNSYLKFYIYTSSQYILNSTLATMSCFFSLVILDMPHLPAGRFLDANNDILPYFSPLCLALSSRQLHISYPISWFVLTHFLFCLSPYLFSSPHLPWRNVSAWTWVTLTCC